MKIIVNPEEKGLRLLLLVCYRYIPLKINFFLNYELCATDQIFNCFKMSLFHPFKFHGALKIFF